MWRHVWPNGKRHADPLNGRYTSNPITSIVMQTAPVFVLETRYADALPNTKESQWPHPYRLPRMLTHQFWT